MDLKTGTLTAKASAGNGQIRYGADVINRIVEQGKHRDLLEKKGFYYEIYKSQYDIA